MKIFFRWLHLVLYNLKKELQTLSYINRLKKDHVYISEKGNSLDRCFFEGQNVVGDHNTLSDITLGYGSYIGKNCNIKRTKIGKYCSIANNISTALGRHPTEQFVSTHPAFFSLTQEDMFGYVHSQKYNEWKWVDEKNKVAVEIGNDVWIANNAIILEGVSVKDGAVICAGAVVTKDVPPYAIVGGCLRKY